MRELYVGLLSGVALFMVFFMVKTLSARSEDERQRYLDDERAVAEVAEALVPLV